jgi:hypothetical protein
MQPEMYPIALEPALIAPAIAPLLNSAGNKRHVGHLLEENCLVNLTGDYSYLENGYYISQDLEASGANAHPTCKEILDGYITPLFLEKGKLNGLPVPEYYITNAYFEPPVVVDTINPFMSRHSIVVKQGHQERVAKSLTRNFTYAICCQELPPNARVGYFRAVLGWCAIPRYRELAEAVWKIYGMPLAVVRIITLEDDSLMLSDLDILPFGSLNSRERLYIERKIDHWQT